MRILSDKKERKRKKESEHYKSISSSQQALIDQVYQVKLQLLVCLANFGLRLKTKSIVDLCLLISDYKFSLIESQKR